MNDKQKRIAAFLIGCMGARLSLVYAAKTLPPERLPYMGAFALLVALGFSIIYVMGWRRTGAEVLGDRIWWDGLRPLHALLWFAFAHMAVRRSPDAWKVLLLDALIGLGAFAAFHTSGT